MKIRIYYQIFKLIFFISSIFYHIGMIYHMDSGSKRFFFSLESQRYAIFCLLKMGAEVFDTDMVIVDKTITDICFENVTIL